MIDRPEPKIHRSAQAVSVDLYRKANSPGSVLEYTVDKLLREMPDASTIIVMVEKWDFSD